MISTVTTKGQITIPKALRDQLDIHPKDKIDFISQGDRIILMPVKTLRDLRGCVTGSGGGPDEERRTAKKAVGRRVSGEMS
ncbi:MAG: AbrB/MazE/SpoVT family DNA-binding domain-containing protein [Desulfobacterales bacterium]|nr:AbrB/MazE/SpoVT family DNA-binding domain-containing protein [Desulfobacterales bacterium]